MNFPKKIDLNASLITCSLLGILGLIFLVTKSGWHLPSGVPVVDPPKPSFSSFIASSGIIESQTDNIELSTNLSGIVRNIHVKVGDFVKIGQPLFTLDTREIQADIKVKEANLFQAQTLLKRSELMFKTAKKRYFLAKKVHKVKVISEDDFLSREMTYLTSEAAVENAKAQIASAKASLEASKTTLERLTVVSPLDAHILQINIHPGEWAAQTPITGSYKSTFTNDPLMILGNSKKMHIRIDIDENEAWRFQKGAKAIAYLRGNSSIKMDLDFVRVEPYSVPKTSLTGLSSERVDTRVLQVIYAFDQKNLPLFVGQQVDAYIEVKGS